MSRPQLWIVAGPNGSGKSTLVNRYIRTSLPVVNPDDIARDQKISPIQAGKAALEQQNSYLASRKSFVLETTLSGKRELPFANKAKDQGYRIRVAFIAVRDPGVSMMRVAQRVAGGGHDVPPADVSRRFSRSIENLPGLVAMADRAFIFDNSGKRRRLLLSLENGKAKFVSTRIPVWAQDSIDSILGTVKSHKIKR
ncbi:zeta toxin family protein [Pseudoduganella ginsengisoli]|uniref:AAA family ATPase n=1 Tax=Pseudoduganella ginsengisoli TaxID=1462440 RepID=A0A6L6Q8V0_9BURK|nr:AAA family ATPase [Pseudoduganella ginsengisoli]